ncbi:hypothetical protein AB0G35_26095 [Streptomyces sp. NPDC021749]|uniref:hypothetical protein n=1 Tax=Streptomyces sp. NPDC021749 TaxID=3154905 RepID=UPI0033C75F84
MSVLTLRLAGPLQSWAVSSRHNIRTTLPYPKIGGAPLYANSLERTMAGMGL